MSRLASRRRTTLGWNRPKRRPRAPWSGHPESDSGRRRHGTHRPAQTENVIAVIQRPWTKAPVDRPRSEAKALRAPAGRLKILESVPSHGTRRLTAPSTSRHAPGRCFSAAAIGLAGPAHDVMSATVTRRCGWSASYGRYVRACRSWRPAGWSCTMTPVEGLPPHGMTKPRKGASGSCHRTDPNRPTGSQPGGQSLRRGLPSPSGGRWALSRGDSQSPVAERPGAARRPIRAPPRDDYVIPAPSPEARTGTCADNTNAPSTDQQPAWLLTPRRGAVCRVSGAGTLITSAPSFSRKGCSAGSGAPPTRSLGHVAPLALLKGDRRGHFSF